MPADLPLLGYRRLQHLLQKAYKTDTLSLSERSCLQIFLFWVIADFNIFYNCLLWHYLLHRNFFSFVLRLIVDCFWLEESPFFGHFHRPPCFVGLDNISLELEEKFVLPIKASQVDLREDVKTTCLVDGELRREYDVESHKKKTKKE